MEGSRKGIKVTDRRMFTSEGEVRDDFVPETESDPDAGTDSPPSAESTVTSAENTATGSERKADPGPASDPNAPPTLFMALADNLIVNAYAALGMVPSSTGARPPADHEAARQMIALLEMLEEKTRGNLEDREAAYLKTHMGELKLAFVRQSQSL